MARKGRMMVFGNMANRERPPFSVVRLRARSAWNGPDSIDWTVKGEKYFGWQVLLLQAITPAPRDLILSRSVYANLFEDTQRHAVVRSVRWDGAAVRCIVRSEGENHIPVLRSRFVLVSIERARSWLSEFEGAAISLRSPPTANSGDQVRLLKTSFDYLSCVYKVTWDVTNPAFDQLAQKWNAVWSGMSSCLLNEPPIELHRENFLAVEQSFNYEISEYDEDVDEI